MVKSGLNVLLEHRLDLLAGRRVGLISHAAAVLPDLTGNVEALLGAGVKLAALYGAEHGFYGYVAETSQVEDAVHSPTGLPVYSLYGATKQITSGQLHEIDVLVFDMQDVGARFYTFLSTLRLALIAAAQAGVQIIVLDRPNPINGLVMEGPILQPGYESFVGPAAIPVRHGMTYGELAQWMNAVQQIGANLIVVPMQGWQRGMWFDQTGLPWVPPSPAMAHPSASITFPGTCLLEGANLSEGRGTPLPFEIAGAPWLDGWRLAKTLNGLGLPGIRFRELQFTPTTAKYAATLCRGVQFHVTDRQAFQPFFTSANLLAVCLMDWQDFSILDTSWEGDKPHLDLLAGSDRLRQALSDLQALQQQREAWRDEIREFEKLRVDYLLYRQ